MPIVRIERMVVKRIENVDFANRKNDCQKNRKCRLSERERTIVNGIENVDCAKEKERLSMEQKISIVRGNKKRSSMEEIRFLATNKVEGMRME